MAVSLWLNVPPRGRCVKINLLPVLLLILLAFGLPWRVRAEMPKQKLVYKDIYLTDEQVCRACRGEWINPKQIKLINRAGASIVVTPQQIIGIDEHPLRRKLLLHSLHNIGIAGPILVPEAFSNGNDFVCKYCKDFP